MQKVVKDIKETKALAKVFLDKIIKEKNDGALVVGLSGELGAGKTHFTQEIAKLLGIKKKLTSPTFVIMKRYALKNKKWKNFFHIDAYRLKSHNEILKLGWQEMISNKENLIFIEWPEMVKKAMPKKYIKVKISHLPKKNKNTVDGRKFSF